MEVGTFSNKKRKLFRSLFHTRLVIFFTLAGAMLFLYANTMLNRAYFQVFLTTDRSSEMQIYWAGENQPFAEERSFSFPITPARQHYRFHLTDLRGVKRLRIDPSKKVGNVALHYIKIHQEEIKFIKLKTIEELKQLKPAGHIQSIEYTNNGLLVKSRGRDPQLLWELNPEILSPSFDTEIIRFIFLIGAAWLIASMLTSSPRILLNYTGIFLWIVAALVLTMAALSRYNKHPD